MSRPRLGVFCAITLLVVAWSAQVLISHVVRLTHEPVMSVLRKGETPPNHRELSAAVAQYQWATTFAPCNAALQADLSLLRAYEADSAMMKLDATQNDAPIEDMQRQLAARLACSPRDGKAWLDIATLDVLREGVTPRALTAYRMSALASPSESWLAKKRLEFALALLPVFSEKERAIVQADLAVLERAHPNSMIAVQTAANVKDKQALYTIFDVKPPSDEP